MSATDSHPSIEHDARPSALGWYVAALVFFVGGVAIGAWQFPHGYDWVYRVASSLANEEKNPTGGIWFSSGWTLAMLLLWRCAWIFKQRLPRPATRAARWSSNALQVGLVFFAITGLDMALDGDLLGHIHKGHELFAFAGFLGTYFGILGLLIHILRAKRFPALPVWLLATPLVAIGITQFWLYITQRRLGWVGPDWRAMGIPFWLSFAFWQWLAIAFLFAGVGLLVWAQEAGERRR